MESKIEVRAYEIWVQEGRPHGRDLEHWIMAAEELAPASAKPRKKAAAAASGQPAATKTEAVAPAKPKRFAKAKSL